MKRRELIAIGGAALVSTRVQAAERVIGWISPEARETIAPFFKAFQAGLQANTPSGDTVRAPDLALRSPSPANAKLEDLPLEDVERLLIKKALDRYSGNVSQAAKALGLSRSALYRRIAAYGL